MHIAIGWHSDGQCSPPRQDYPVAVPAGGWSAGCCRYCLPWRCSGLQTRPGIDVLLRMASSLSNGALQLDDWQGPLAERRRIARPAHPCRHHADPHRPPAAALGSATVVAAAPHIDTLQLGRLEITTAASKHPPQMPVDLQLPLALQIDHLVVTAWH